MKTTGLILSLVVMLAVGAQSALAQPKENPQPAVERETSAAVPDLADIVSLAGKVNGRLNDLERQMKRGLDLSAIR
jgi:hypothetical protein